MPATIAFSTARPFSHVMTYGDCPYLHVNVSTMLSNVRLTPPSCVRSLCLVLGQALLSPSTGIVDSHALMLALQGDAEDLGTIVSLRTPVNAIQVTECVKRALLKRIVGADVGFCSRSGRSFARTTA